MESCNLRGHTSNQQWEPITAIEAQFMQLAAPGGQANRASEWSRRELFRLPVSDTCNRFSESV